MSIWRWIGWGSLVVALTAAESTVPVSPELAKALTAAQEQSDPLKGLAELEPHKESGNVWVHLLRGQLLSRLARDGEAAQRATRQREAEAAFQAALALDGQLRQARLGLAQLAADRGDWTQASVELGEALDWNGATRSELLFAANVAIQANDWRAATVLLEQGIVRFPAEPAFRRMELAALVRGGRPEEARQAVRALLARTPDDAELWRHLAWAAHELQDEPQALAARELALLAQPDNRASRRDLAAAQLNQQQPQAAFLTLRPLIGDPPTPEALRDIPLMELAVRVAADAGETALGRTWAAAVPPTSRTRTLRLFSAQLALRQKDPQAASTALAELVAQGEKDAAVLVWAGQVAEQAGDAPAAESFYTLSASSDQPAGAIASLRLVGLYLKQSRRDDARIILATHLIKHPDDASAQALKASLDRSPK